jgi:Xaa-Pro aminopeptidase
LVDPALLSAAEREWLDGYHRRVREALAGQLSREEAGWLARATRPL